MIIRMRKTNKQYFFSVEGETERMYLEWLQKQINSHSSSKHKVDIKVKVAKDPMRFVKSLQILGKTEVWHLFDYEGSMASNQDAQHLFESTLEKMKKAEKQKNISYKLGYCNLSFELWMILHKKDCSRSFNRVDQYLPIMNSTYQLSCTRLSDYKEKDVFQKCLGQLSLNDVNDAIKRADRMICILEENSVKLSKYNGYQFYTKNPSLSIHEPMKKILSDCGLRKI